MAPDVEPPDPPELTNRGVPSAFERVELSGGEADLRRADLEAALRDGAWRDGLGEWAEYTDLAPGSIRLLAERGLFECFDFYWDPVEEGLAFEPPSLPDDLGGTEDGTEPSDADLPDRATLRTELRDLGETVVDALGTGYLDWTDGVDCTVWDDGTAAGRPVRLEASGGRPLSTGNPF